MPGDTSDASEKEPADQNSPADDEEDDEEPVSSRRRQITRSKDQHQPSEKVAPAPRKAHTPSSKAATVKKEVKREDVEPLEPPSSKRTSRGRISNKSANTKKSVVKKESTHGRSPKVEGESKAVAPDEDEASDAEIGEEEDADPDEEKPEIAAKAREKVQASLKGSGKDPYPDWKAGEPVPYAALCTTFSLIEMTTKRLIISSHCSLFLRQVLRLTPGDLLPTIHLMINKLAADYAGVELGIGESLIMKAIGETTGRSLSVIKADQAQIGDLGLVAAKSRSNQPTMFKPKALTVRGVLDGLMGIATVSGHGSQDRKVAGIKKLLSAADVSAAGKGSKGIDITKDKGGASETKFIIRFLEGKLRLGLAEKTVLVALAHAMVSHETEKKGNKVPTSDSLSKGEAILKTVYRLAIRTLYSISLVADVIPVSYQATR